LVNCHTSTFDATLPFWKILWPGRISPINSMSSMMLSSGYDMEIYRKYIPSFFCIKFNNTIVGVISGHRTQESEYRTRGLWIDESFRGRGLSKMLLNQIKIQATNEKCKILWTIPRKTSLYSYEKFGFKKIGKFFNKNVEFGPNCYAIMEL